MNDSIDIPAPPEPVPLKTAHELKERTMRDYMRNAGLPGMPIDAREMEKLVMSDLALSDGYERDERPLPAAKQESAEEAAESRRLRDFKLGQLLPDNTRLIRRELEAASLADFLDLPPEIETSEKWRLARGRMVRIMEGASAAPRTPDGRLDFRAMTSTCNYPRGAYELIADMFSFEYRYEHVTRKHNPFFGMSKRDASLAFVARAMNICDRSTGTSMGQWFVPK